MPIPILRHKKLVEIGFLTSAYLLWFRELGYSWALQSHLDIIREQICHPTRQILPPNFSALYGESMFDRPQIGIGEVAGELVLFAGIANHIVFLPPADRPHFYETLPNDFEGLSLGKFRFLQFYRKHQFEGPVGLVFGTRAVVVPDVLRTGSDQDSLIVFVPDGGAPQVLHLISGPITEAQYQEVRTLLNVVHIDIRNPRMMPGRETGSPSGETPPGQA